MHALFRYLTGAAALMLSAVSALAQDGGPSASEPVALVADRISFDEETGILTASGAVEMYQNGRTLTASAIRYDSRSERIAATGPIVLRTAEGETVYADEAELDADLRDGLVKGARSVIQGGGKIAAFDGQRIDGRYNVLNKAVFSPCEVCAERPVPLWRIRAERIVHDQQERVIHYENAYFDVLGVPVGFLPYFRHPSPEVDRATGFLAPSLGRDKAYGVGVKAPFFVVIDDYSDVTLTPFVTSSDGPILGTEYRRMFEKGYLNLDLQLGVTDYGGDGKGARVRLGGFGEGRYLLSEGVHAGFDLAFATDDPFLRRYDFTDADRLTTEGFVRAYDGRNRASVGATYMQSLRDGDPQGRIPLVLPELSMRHVWNEPLLDGEFAIGFDSVGLVREDGRDLGRVTLGADWSRQTILESGLVLRGFADARADFYKIGDDPAFDGEAARFTPRVGVEARVPFVRADAGGATHVLEPIVQFAAAPDVSDRDIPNEDSVIAEFDEMNLFETDRFTGFDRVETGVNVTVGARYEAIDDDGLGLRASGGRIVRLDRSGDFSDRSGLTGDFSDYVGAVSVTYDDWLEIGGRWRLSDNFGVNRAEAGGRFDFDPLSLYGYYLFVEDDPAEQAPVDRSEVNLGGALALTRNWAVSAEAQRDLEADRFTKAGAVLTYEDECAGLDLYVRRRFTESSDAPDGTSFGVRVRLFGAGGGDRNKASGACAFGAQ